MYCGHCGAAVGERDDFCNACGARFVDGPSAAPDPWAASAAPLPPPTVAGAAMATRAVPAVDPTRTMPTVGRGAPPGAPPPGGPPTTFVPLAPGPRSGGWRPFAIGAAFALIVVAGVFAYFAMRDDKPGAAPDPSGPAVLSATTTTTIEPTTVLPTTLPPTTLAPTLAPTVAPTAPPTAPPTEAPTTAAQTPATTGAGPTPTVAPITVVTTAATATTPTAAPTVVTTPRTTPATTPRTTAAPRPTVAPTTTVATTGNVPPKSSATVSAVRSSATRPNGVDSCGQTTGYGPLNLLDGSNATAWMTVGSGGGQSVEFTLRKGVEISTVGLVPGYAKVDPCTGQDRFLDMRRIAEVSWSFDGGEEIIQELDVESATMQTMDLPAPVAASKVRMTIRVTTPPGTDGFDYAPISEVTVS